VQSTEGETLKKYRRIEVSAYQRKVTVVSGAWRPDELFEATPAPSDDEVLLNDSGVDEPVEPDSPEGQMILAEAVLLLERRLSPETRATFCEVKAVPARSNLKSFFHRLRSFLSRNKSGLMSQREFGGEAVN
jgi:hypothetical protein